MRVVADPLPPEPRRLDPQIARWLDDSPVAEIDFGDVAAIREMSDSYMRETGGPGPRYDDPRVRLAPLRLAGVEALVWTPRDATGFGPTVLAAHGGGFIVGSALGAERIAVRLAAEFGITTVSVEYRLAPEHPAPAAVVDMTAVLDALHTRSDVTALAVHGSSAGACLAAGTALWARDHGIALRGQSLSCPALDDRIVDEVWSPTWTPQAARWMWRHYLGGDPPPP